MEKTVLLTGATGFLGSHILRTLVERDYEVVILKRSFSDVDRIENISNSKITLYDIDTINPEIPFAENDIETVIHAATLYGKNGESTGEILKANLLFPVNLIESGIKYRLKNFINIDTFFNSDKFKYEYLSDYILTKKQFIEWGKTFKAVKFINCKLFHLYGPNDDGKKFINWLLLQLINEVPEIQLSGGMQRRDFIFVDDAVEAIIKILENTGRHFAEYEIGTGNSIAIKDIILLTKELIERERKEKLTTDLKFGALQYREGEPFDEKADIKNLAELGWRPTYSLEKGMQRTLHSVQEQLKIQKSIV